MVATSRFTHSTTRIGVRAAAVIVAGMLSVAGLSACTNPVAPAPSHKPTASKPPATKPTATPTPTPTEPPTPVTLTCEQVVTPQQLYDFNPNYGTDPGYAPEANSLQAAIVSDQGVACGFLNQTSNAVIEVAIAKPAESSMTARKNTTAGASQVVPTYGVPPTVEGYFTVTGGAGQAQIFSNGYWIVLQSKEFAEPGDAQPLAAAVLQNLPPA
jgi:hypothetical protein